MKVKYLKIISSVLIGICSCSTLQAQQSTTYPDKSVRVIIPFPPGGTLDKVGRMLALKLGEQLGQTFYIENKPGGNGVIGADIVAKAPNDGYTLLFNASTFVTAPLTMKSVPYKVQTDFSPIGLVAVAPLSISVGNQLGVSNLKGLMDYSKTHSDSLNFAVGSIGSAGHLCTVKLEQALGSNISIVAYKGTGPAMVDLVGGQIDGFIDPVLGSVQFYKGGKLKMLAVTSNKRLPSLPEIATASESINGFNCSSWYGLWGPAKLQSEISKKLNTAVNKALEGDMHDRLLADGIFTAGGSEADFIKYQANEIAVSAKIIADKKISVE